MMPSAEKERPVSSPLRLAADTKLFDRNDQIFDLVGMRAELLGELVEHRFGNFLETRFVDVSHDLDAHPLELGGSRLFEIEGLFWLLRADIAASRQHPFLLVGVQALPQFIADPENGIVGLVFGHRQYWRRLIVLVDEVD